MGCWPMSVEEVPYFSHGSAASPNDLLCVEWDIEHLLSQSQGSVVTRLRCGAIHNYVFIKNILSSLVLKNLKISQYVMKLTARV